jgi:hypothetical protein
VGDGDLREAARRQARDASNEMVTKTVTVNHVNHFLEDVQEP